MQYASESHIYTYTKQYYSYGVN